MAGSQQSQEFRVFTADYRFVGFISAQRARQMVGAKHVHGVRKKDRSGSPVGPVHFYVLNADMSANARRLMDDVSARAGSIGATTAVHYTEEMNALTGKTTGYMVTLKKVGPEGSFVRWSDSDEFNPRRFNPDMLPKPIFPRLSAVN